MNPSPAETPRLRLLPGPGSPRFVNSAAMPQPSVIAQHLTPVDRRIALALHAAQGAAISVPGLALTHPEPPAQPRTVSEIVEMAEHRGWSQVFKALKSNGLLVEQTLGHVVARWRDSAGRAELLS